jgi:hypothetical protein
MARSVRLPVLLLAGVLPACDPAGPPGPAPEDAPPKADAKAVPLTRLVFQDHAARAVKWADVSVTESGELSLGPVSGVDGFPALDAGKQKLVQMGLVDGKLLVGVRDDEDGAFASGWVLVGTGVRYTDHGDHGHWSFRKKPFVIGSRIDKEQGNPAHLYVYGDKFYLANDHKNGYTRLDPADFPRVANPHAGTRGRFLPGGGNHITLAVVGDAVGYGCWIDGGGPNKGRVDVTPLAGSAVAYSFALPTGVIHGATACEGKVFFAPADGVCWVEADREAKLKPDQVKVRHVPLGVDGDKPLRTGAFATHGKYVLCVIGKEAGSKLALLDASSADPKPVFVPLTGQAKHKPVTPAAVTVGGKAPHALVFHDHDRKEQAADRLDVIALDPNGDGDFADARVAKSLAVGPSAVDGHSGHHAVAFDADGAFAFFTNPGDGTVAALDLKKLDVVATFKVGGMPTAVVAHGGRETED